MKAEENGLCQVLVEPDASVDRIFDIFQNSTYRDRIAIFHYGGHAESYSLLLESASGGKVKAHSEGLVAFLAKQKSLKLVFLNGCSSQKQSQELVAAGLPAVIGTSQAINDIIATGLSTRFYKGISSGMTIERAWADAIDQIKTENGPENTKGLFWEGILGSPEQQQFPWELYTGEGGEFSKIWNLPEAANHPLFGLELPKTYYRKLPTSPYVGLRSFARDEAAIFFGRGHDIRKIYTLLEREQPVILISGKKGVGKSSLFAAGLAPRFESVCEISLCQIGDQSPEDALSEALGRTRESLGLGPLPPKSKSVLEEKIAALQASLFSTSGFAKEILELELDKLNQLAGKERLTFHEQWMSIEEKSGKPLVVLLDQIPNDPEHWTAFTKAVFSIFEVKPTPKGKLILSIDEESHRAFCGLLQADGFPYAEVFLQPLNWDGLQEAITGVTLSPATREFYKLQIENSSANNFPMVLTGHLVDGDTSLVAPFLQVIMTALWEKAVLENPQAPVFTLGEYQEQIISGGIMDEFLTRQLALLKDWKKEPIESGLALDLLYLHTSALGKSSLLDTEARAETYGDRQELVNSLVRQCKELYLLTGADPAGTYLGHNLLALVVIRHYSVSLSPGQQAARILNSKTGEAASPDKSSWLNEADLEDVEKGLPGMRSLNENEENLLAYSRIKKAEAEKERKRNRIIKRVLVSIVALFGIIAASQWYLAYQRYLYSRAGELAFTSKEVNKTDNTLAINIARQAYSVLTEDSPPEVMQTLSEIFHSQETQPFYAAKFQHRKVVNTAVFSPDGSHVLTASEDGFVKLWERNGREILSLPHEVEVFMASFSPNGQQILTITREHVHLWEMDGTLTDKDPIPETMINLDSFSTDGMKIIPAFVEMDTSAYGLTVTALTQETTTVIPSPSKNRILVLQNGGCSLLDKNGSLLKDLLHSEVINAIFSRNGEKFLTSSREGDKCHISIWSESGDSIFSFRCQGEKVNAVFSPDGKSILTSSNDFTAKIWDFSDPFLHRFPRQRQSINMVDFFPEGNRYLTASFDSTAKIWDISGKLIDSLKHDDVVISAYFSPDGKQIITASRDRTARLWTPRESKVVPLYHRAEVTRAVFSKDNHFVLTASFDSLARLWTSDGTLVDSFQHKGEVSWACFSPDASKLATISSDSTVTIWERSGEILHVLKHPARIFSVAFSEDGNTLLTSCGDSTVRQWTSEGEPVLKLSHFERPRIALFTADGKHILTGGRMVKIWNTQGILKDSLSHTENVSSIVVSPDSRLILTTSFDQNGYLWNFKGELLARYRNHTAKINSGCFTPDGSHVLTAADDGYILRWNTPKAIFDKLNSAEIAPLSENETEQYDIKRWPTPKMIFGRIKSALINLLTDKKEVRQK